MGLRRHLSIVTLTAALALTPFACKSRTGANSGVSGDGSPVKTDGADKTALIENSSEWMSIDEATMNYHADYAWLDQATSKREHHLEIWDRGIQMIGAAQKFIVFSVFLFDCMYSPIPPVRDITGEVLDAIIKRKSEVPGLKVAIILDPIHRAYVNRVAPAVKKLNEAGIDVFYTDLLVTPPAARTGIIQAMHKSGLLYEQLAAPQVKQLLEEAVNSDEAQSIPRVANLTPVINDLLAGKPLQQGGQPVSIDGQPFNLELIYEIALLKANHRKLLVTDNGESIDALVGSSNPHRASIPSANSAISFRGPLGAYIYNVVRKDIAHSIEQYSTWQSRTDVPEALRAKYAARFAMWSTQGSALQRAGNYLTTEMPALPIEAPNAPGATLGKFVTESKIRDEIIAGLKDVGPEDEVRIQMFYLSNRPVIDAILAAGKVTTKPVRLILDPNKDAFNAIKDGTPNRQVATFMREEAQRIGSKIEIRWYDTHGEQNHAKVMSITNPQGKCWFTTGSANWTGKNIGGANMESNMVVKGGQKLCATFGTLFERFWRNEPGKTYTVDWNTAPYNTHAGMPKWERGEATGLVAW